MAVITEFNDEAEYDKVCDKYTEEAAGLTEEECKQRADEFKKQGNDCFAKKEYKRASYYYSIALLFTPTNEILFSNRAQCHLRTEEYGSALTDAESAITHNPKYAKGHYRKGCALLALSRYKLASNAFTQAYKLQPDSETKKRIDSCEKLHREERFRAALASEYTASAIEKIKLNSLPSYYSGPAFDPTAEYDPKNPFAKYSLEFYEYILDYQAKCNVVPIQIVHSILHDIYGVLKSLPSLVDVPLSKDYKVAVVGDTHGQYYDVLNIFKLYGKPGPTQPYLFNGDFVDRGSFSYEVVICLFLSKLLYPNHVHLARGNHESISMNNLYGFKGEVFAKAKDTLTFDIFTEVFDALPLGHCLGNQVLVVHGGLFEEPGVTLDQLRKIDRFRQPPESGNMCDILWSDPGARPGKQPPHRGCGVVFGKDVTEEFLNNNNLKLLVRSHEVKQPGYSIDHDGKCITVFSAPNYCDQMGNKGAVLFFDENAEYTIEQFDAVEHPPVPAMKYANQMARF